MAAQLGRTNWRQRHRFGAGTTLVLSENDANDRPFAFLTLTSGFGLYQRRSQFETNRRRERDADVGEGKQEWMARLDPEGLTKSLIDRVRWFECAGCLFTLTDSQYLERRDEHWELYGQLIKPAGS